MDAWILPPSYETVHLNDDASPVPPGGDMDVPDVCVLTLDHTKWTYEVMATFAGTYEMRIDVYNHNDGGFLGLGDAWDVYAEKLAAGKQLPLYLEAGRTERFAFVCWDKQGPADPNKPWLQTHRNGVDNGVSSQPPTIHEKQWFQLTFMPHGGNSATCTITATSK